MTIIILVIFIPIAFLLGVITGIASLAWMELKDEDKQLHL
jgi:hypothetical protein